MGTKAEWRNNMLRFHGDPMFTAVASASTNVRLTLATVKTPTVVVACPIYANTLSTGRNMHFHARIGGICASSSGFVFSATLRYGTTTIMTIPLPGSSGRIFNSRVIPYNVDFYGRFANASSSGHIAAGAIGVMGSKATTSFNNCIGTLGSTNGAGTKFTTSDINLRTVDSTLGLNVVVSIATTSLNAAGKAMAITNTIGYIELFSG